MRLRNWNCDAIELYFTLLKCNITNVICEAYLDRYLFLYHWYVFPLLTSSEGLLNLPRRNCYPQTLLKTTRKIFISFYRATFFSKIVWKCNFLSFFPRSTSQVKEMFKNCCINVRFRNQKWINKIIKKKLSRVWSRDDFYSSVFFRFKNINLN